METAAVEKISVESVEGNISFNKYELKNFVQEIFDMGKEGKEIDIPRAIRNARYLAIIDKGIEQMNKGGGHTVNDEEIRSMIYDA